MNSTYTKTAARTTVHKPHAISGQSNLRIVAPGTCYNAEIGKKWQ